MIYYSIKIKKKRLAYDKYDIVVNRMTGAVEYTDRICVWGVRAPVQQFSCIHIYQPYHSGRIWH